MAKNPADVRLLTTELPLQGEHISSSWMVWSGEYDSVSYAVWDLRKIAARDDANAVIGIRVVAQPRLRPGLISDDRYEPKYTAYGTAVIYG
ncbi:hypothetical protein [Streptomyces synnematoformans]|uniref:Uncharacterized protein n=1 Tax=Streptomyces synnematoformans TaxID=415721 RepID=A0ABN2ADA0_9ACTN